MQSNSNLYERIAALPLGSRDREHALRSLSSAEAFIDSIEGSLALLRRGVHALDGFRRGIFRQLKAS